MVEPISPLSPVAQYVRMSSERQDCSLEFQRDAIAAYALAHGYEVIRTYEDAGLSGLTIEKREGLRSLLADVVAGTAPFRIVLVYDVSRWGRFQNPDQSAHYEFLCAEAGVSVEYCAEAFANDGSPTSMLLKHIKRAMAAEYSRELSQKARQAKLGLRREGYWMGSRPGYGLRREIVTRSGKVLARRELGEWGRYPGGHTRLEPWSIVIVRAWSPRRYSQRSQRPSTSDGRAKRRPDETAFGASLRRPSGMRSSIVSSSSRPSSTRPSRHSLGTI
jgi:DNA invertase Pin-like site-specific DNA recombinase